MGHSLVARNYVKAMTKFMKGIVEGRIVSKKNRPNNQRHHRQNDGYLDNGIKGYPNSFKAVFI
jgi:hypothetical protein